MLSKTTLFFLLSLGLCFVNQSGVAQNRIYGNADLQWANRHGGKKSSRLFLLYDKSSGELSAEVALFPLIENSQQRDSASRSFSPLKLYLKGIFPHNLPESFSVSDNEKQMLMEVKIQIGDSIETRTISLILTMLQDNNTSSAPSGLNTSILPCRANFVLALEPARFGLHKSGLKWKQKFMVEIENGIINKK